MKHTKPICLVLITIFIFTPVLHKETLAAEHPYVDEWDFSGTRHLPKHRQMVFPIGALDPYRMRTFVYLLDEDGINLVFVENNSVLAKFLVEQTTWEELYRDDLAVVFARK